MFGARHPGQDRGFVLVLVLAMLVILSLLAGTVAVVSQRLRDQELARKRLEDAEIGMADTKATLLYLLLTQRMTFGGLTVDGTMVLTEAERNAQREGEPVVSYMPVGNELALDDRAYAGLGGTAFGLQDDRGRISFNWVTSEALERWLRESRITAIPAPTLVNLLLDYQDGDDLYRLNSAEREGYEKEGRPPPANATLATPIELRAVKGWDVALSKFDDTALMGTFTSARAPLLNVNTASASALLLVPGVDPGIAERIVARRVLGPFVTMSAFHSFTGTPLADEERLSLYPSDSGTMRLWAPGGGLVHVLHWTLTPWDDGGRPWREDYELNLPQDSNTTPAALARPAAKVLAEPVPASGG